jgi:hypothetical protein
MPDLRTFYTVPNERGSPPTTHGWRLALRSSADPLSLLTDNVNRFLCQSFLKLRQSDGSSIRS